MTRAVRRFEDGEDEAPPSRDRTVRTVSSPARAVPARNGTERSRPQRPAAVSSAEDRPRSEPVRRPAGGARGRPPSSLVGSWRLWVVPLLVVLTVLAVVQAVSPGADTGSAASLLTGTPPSSSPVVGEAPAGVGANVNIPTAELPSGGAFPVSGAGTWHVVPGTSPQAGTGRVYTYTVEVEDGAVLPEGDAAFATAVESTLSDPRSWVGSGQIAVRRVDAGVPDFRISLTSQLTTRGQCGYEVRYEASCWKSDIKRVLINGARWVRGAGAFDGQLGLYRQYAINHEVGHVFDNRHVPCETNGALAPVMMQQSFGTSDDYLAQLTEENPQGLEIPRDGKTCQPNAWPYPNGALRP